VYVRIASPDENVEIIRRGLQVFNERDVDAAVGTWHEDGEFAPAMAGAVEGKTYRGHAELRRYFDDLFGSFSDVHVEDPELRDLGDRVLILYRLIVHGRDSDLTIDQPAGALYELRDGKTVYARSFLSRAEALEAAGLSE